MLTPTSFSARGEAKLALPDGRQVLMWQAIPGEKALMRLEHKGQTQDYAKWMSAPVPHKHRVTPMCEKYSTCGGCPWMHLDKQGQQDARTTMVRSALDEVGIDAKITKFHPSPDGDREFRYVVKVAFGESDDGRLKVGAWGRRGRHVIPIPDCHVAAPILRKVMDAIAYHAIELNLRPYDPETDRGVLRVAVLRASRATNQVLITFVVGRYVRELQDLAEAVAMQVNQVVGVWLHENEGPGNAIFLRDGDGVVGVRPILGKMTIEEKLGDITYDIGPGDFFQTNPSVAEVLYKRVIERSGAAPGIPFVDLYCGVGGIALQAAKVTGWALGVEEIDGAVTRARDSARKNGVAAEFVVDPVKLVLPDVTKRLGDARPIVCVDPARRGLEEGVAQAIVDMKPRRIVYVSCNATAMARDLVVFREAGFVIGDVELFDMFPHASHVETLVTLDAPDADTAGGRRAPQRRKAGQPGKA